MIRAMLNETSGRYSLGSFESENSPSRMTVIMMVLTVTGLLTEILARFMCCLYAHVILSESRQYGRLLNGFEGPVQSAGAPLLPESVPGFSALPLLFDYLNAASLKQPLVARYDNMRARLEAVLYDNV